MRWFWLILLLFSSVPVTAQPAEVEPVEGRIVQIRESELVVDLGSSVGLAEGAKIDIYRRLIVKHPVTGEVMEDRFPIGTVRLEQVGKTLSIARDLKGLTYPPKDGDYVLFETGPEPTWPKLSAEPSSPEAKVVESTFHQTLGQPIDQRIALWDQFLSRFPDSEFAETVSRERDWLQNRLAAEREMNAKLEETEEDRLRRELASLSVDGRTSAPTEVWVDQPVRISAGFARRDRVSRVRVLIREESEPTYETIPMSANGDSTFTADVPMRFVREPQDVQYFVEVVRTDGELERVDFGMDRIVVERPPNEPEPGFSQSRARVESEWVDFKTGAGVDQFWRVEGSYRYRIGTDWINAFRVGAGMFQGEGNSVEGIESGESSKPLGLGYGFAEVRQRYGRYVGLGLTGMFGNRQGSSLDTFTSTLGLRTDIVLGVEDGTQIALGLSLVGGLGVETWLDLKIEEIERVPMRAQVVVTNLPIGADLGVSLKYGAGYEVVDGLEVLAQVGWNARTITHHGPGAGLSLSYKW